MSKIKWVLLTVTIGVLAWPATAPFTVIYGVAASVKPPRIGKVQVYFRN